MRTAAVFASGGGRRPPPLVTARKRRPPSYVAAQRVAVGAGPPASTPRWAVTAQDAELRTEEESEELRALTLAFLQRIKSAEKMLEAGDYDSGLNYSEFSTLLGKLALECKDCNMRALFDTIDVDGDGRIQADEIRESLRSSDAITSMYSESLQNVALSTLPAIIVGIGFFIFKGPTSCVDFFTGYIVEDSLSVDNLFVFITLFEFFKVPHGLQTYCLNLGIYGAIVLRAIFISGGLAAVQSFQPLLLVFSLFLLYASYSALAPDIFGTSDGEDEESKEPPGAIRGILAALPTTPFFEGDKLIVQGPTGNWLATPLGLCIVAIELSDILFAVDSIPAVFAVTEDPLIVFSSNILAIIGLRSLYQVLSIAVADLVYLEKTVAVVLGFVGLKLGLQVAGVEAPSAFSLFFIVSTLLFGVIASLAEQSAAEDDKAGKTHIREKAIGEKIWLYFLKRF